jgi:hypothetical protein
VGDKYKGGSILAFLRVGFLDSAEKLLSVNTNNFCSTTYMVFGGLLPAQIFECLKILQKMTFFSVFRKKKIKFFLMTAQNFFRFITHIQSKKSHLAEYDIVGMFAENLVEVGYVWWVDSGKIFFFRIHQKKYSTLKLLIVSTNNFFSTSF